MDNAEYTAIVQHWHARRREYINPILRALSEQTVPPVEAIIWNNSGGTPIPTLEGNYNMKVTEILSGRNTLLGRYAAILVSRTRHVLVHDDDLILYYNSAEIMARRMFLDEASIIGPAGVILDAASNTPYTDGLWRLGPVDVILGRCWMADKERIGVALGKMVSENAHPGRADDIWVSMNTPGPKISIGPMPNLFKNLNEKGVGLSHEPPHMAERNAMARQLIDKMEGGK